MFRPRFNLRNETVVTLRVPSWMTLWLGYRHHRIKKAGGEAGFVEGAGWALMSSTVDVVGMKDPWAFRRTHPAGR